MKMIITGLPVAGPVVISVFSCLHRKTNTQGREDTRSGHILIFLWRCKLKPLQNENLKKPIINLSQNIIHMTSIFLIFNVFWIRANTVNVRGKNSIIWVNHRVLIKIGLNYCTVRWIAWTKNNYFRDCVHVIRSKQVHEHIVRLQCVLFSLFYTQRLWIIFRYCSAATKIQRSYKAH